MKKQVLATLALGSLLFIAPAQALTESSANKAKAAVSFAAAGSFGAMALGNLGLAAYCVSSLISKNIYTTDVARFTYGLGVAVSGIIALESALLTAVSIKVGRDYLKKAKASTSFQRPNPIVMNEKDTYNNYFFRY